MAFRQDELPNWPGCEGKHQRAKVIKGEICKAGGDSGLCVPMPWWRLAGEDKGMGGNLLC